jgi:hypothetical protein
VLDACSPTLLQSTAGILHRSALVHCPDSGTLSHRRPGAVARSQARYQIRQEQAPSIWKGLKERAQELQPKLLPQSTLGQAVNYFLNECDALLRYLEDGRFEIDNNLVENDIRPTAVGRKRWLFIGHPDAGWRSAVIYSLLISARRRGLNPQIYSTDVLAPRIAPGQLESSIGRQPLKGLRDVGLAAGVPPAKLGVIFWTSPGQRTKRPENGRRSI